MDINLLLYFSFLLSLSLQANAFGKCRPQDKAALLAFRKTFIDDPSANSDCILYDWKEIFDCCFWDGIQCHSSTGNVIGVNFDNSCSKGTSSTFSSSSSLFHLSSLQSIYFSKFNFQRSTIPKEIAKLSQLRTLIIIGSNLTGTIPAALASLPQLRFVHLRENSLTGTIPAAFFSHPRLSDLDLSSNKLQGSFPTAIPRPSNLTQLTLSGNQLVGTIPAWLFNIAYLETLDLSSNSLGPLQPFPEPAATSLVSVDLSFNKIGGQVPSSLMQLVKVTSLNLEANQLTGVVQWNIFKNMVNLTELTLSFNRGLTLKNTDGPPVVLPFFRTLDVRSCGLTEFPNFLSVFSDFQYLDVSDNRIGGSIFKGSGWAKLSKFNGSHNQITSFDFPKDNQRIYWFDMSYNSITGPLPKPTSTLVLLSLVHNKFNGPIPTQYCNLINIETLDLSYNNLDGVLPPCLMNISRDLRVLSLQNNRLRGVIPDTFGLDVPNNQLNILLLSDNNFEGPLPKSLTACKNLMALSVGNNQISDTFPSYLGQIANLQILILSSNKFRGSIGAPATKDQFSNLQILDVSSNNFTGPLPDRMIQNLKYMTSLPVAIVYLVGGGTYGWNGNFYTFLVSVDVTVKGVKLKNYNVQNTQTILDFSNNQFSGEIPAVIGNLKALQVLALSQNRLSGGIPATIGNMTELESLDLSRNKVGGRIPTSLRNLKHLEYLNLSYNNLGGPIPPGNFPSDSYLGNPGLCGPPLTKAC